MPSISPAAARPEVRRRNAAPRHKSWWFQLHFWIGWLAAIPLLAICLTGIALAFEKEFYRWEQPEFYDLVPGGNRLSLPEVLDRYKSATPRLHLIYLEIPETPERAYLAFASEIDENGNTRGLRAYLNPYTGEISREFENPTLIRKLEDLHRRLTFGKTGRRIVAASSLLLAVTSIAGLILWWPMRKGTLTRTLRRKRALDWHNTIGLLALLPLIVLGLTGITYTWGKQIFPVLERLQGHPSHFEIPEIPIAENNSTETTASLAEVANRIQNDFPKHEIRGIQDSRNFSRPYIFSLKSPTDIHPGGNLRLFIDPRTGDEFSRYQTDESGPAGWYRRYFGILHTGDIFSWPVRVFWALASLAGFILTLTGAWISIRRWIRRKPVSRPA